MIFLSIAFTFLSQRLVLLPHAVDRCVAASRDGFAKDGRIRIIEMVAVWLLVATVADGQGPGTLPPPGMLQESEPWPEQLEGIRPEAFLFQDESNTPVVMPRMSFEEIDRLRRLDRSGKSGDQIATLDSLSIVGTMGHARAQWQAELAIRLDGVGVRESVGRSVVVDIGFAGAHLLRAAEIRFASLENATASPPGDFIRGAYVRLTPSERPTQVDASVFRSSTRVSDESGALDGRLASSTTLPQNFPAELRQAMVAGGDDLTYHDRGYQLVLPIEPLLEKLLTPRSSMVVKVHLPFCGVFGRRRRASLGCR